MLTRALIALLLVLGTAVQVSAEETKVLALGVTNHEVTQAELDKGDALPVPHFNTPALAYVLAANLKQGDVIEISLNNNDRSLLHNTETLTEDRASILLQAGKRGVPAGGWPEGTYHAAVKIVRDGKPLIEQRSAPVAFE